MFQELPPAYPREPMSRAEDEGDGAAAPSLVLERVRRNRTAVNYAEKAGDARSRPGEHISAVLAEADEQAPPTPSSSPKPNPEPDPFSGPCPGPCPASSPASSLDQSLPQPPTPAPDPSPRLQPLTPAPDSSP